MKVRDERQSASLAGHRRPLRVETGRRSAASSWRYLMSLGAQIARIAARIKSNLTPNGLATWQPNLDLRLLEPRILWSASPLASIGLDVHDWAAGEAGAADVDDGAIQSWLAGDVLDSQPDEELRWPALNTAPYLSVPIPGRRIEANDLTIVLNLSGSIADDDIQRGDRLSFAATSSNEDIVSVSTDGRYLSLRLDEDFWGEATVRVQATDLLGESTVAEFLMDVRQPRVVEQGPDDPPVVNSPDPPITSDSDIDDQEPLLESDSPNVDELPGEAALVETPPADSVTPVFESPRPAAPQTDSGNPDVSPVTPVSSGNSSVIDSNNDSPVDPPAGGDADSTQVPPRWISCVACPNVHRLRRGRTSILAAILARTGDAKHHSRLDQYGGSDAIHDPMRPSTASGVMSMPLEFEAAPPARIATDAAEAADDQSEADQLLRSFAGQPPSVCQHGCFVELHTILRWH